MHVTSFGVDGYTETHGVSRNSVKEVSLTTHTRARVCSVDGETTWMVEGETTGLVAPFADVEL